jgi:DNA-binding NarL/FixJ family response regulator
MVQAMNADRIVLIDDDRSWLEALAEYLQRKGFFVVAATDPDEVLVLLRKNSISVVICDYDMPGMTGLELVRSIRQQAGNVAVLMVSSAEEPTLVKRALAEGVRDFLPKTASPMHLVRKLRQILADLDAAAAPNSTLHLWQRLLPSPQQPKRRENKNRPAARSSRKLLTSGPNGSSRPAR